MSFVKSNSTTNSNSKNQQPTNPPNEEARNNKKHYLLLLYKGKIGDNKAKPMKKIVQNFLPETVQT